MIKPEHCVRCVNITRSEVISKSISRSADGLFFTEDVIVPVTGVSLQLQPFLIIGKGLL